MIVTPSLVGGFKNSIRGKIFGFWGHIQIEHFGSNQSFESVPIDIDQPFYPHLDTIKGVHYRGPSEILGFEIPNTKVDKTTNGGIRHIQVYATKAGIIKTDDQLEGVVLKGVSTDFDWTFLKEYLIEGELIDLPDSSISKDILISQQTANRLKLGVGDKFIVHFVERSQRIRQFIIKGIYRTGLEEYDRRFALVDIRQIQKLNQWDYNQVSGFEVFVDDIDDIDPIYEHIYYTQLPTNIFSQTIMNVYPAIFGWLELQDTNENVILIVMLIACFINMITVLLILILERTNMIGTLKALGQNNWEIRKIFLYYALYILVVGLFWGNLLGIGLCTAQDYFGFIQLPEESYYVKVAPIDLDFWKIIFLNIITLVTTLVVMLIPSYLITTITPVKAIRFK